MRIAVCLSGEPRAYLICYKTLKNIFSEVKVDYFISTWQHCQCYHEQLVELYNPKKISYEPSQDFTKYHDKILQTYGTSKFSFLGMFDMCYLIKKSINLVDVKENYDWVIRARFDLRFDDNKKFPFHLLNPQAINFPTVENYCGYNDQFFVAKKDIMNKVADIFNWLPSSISRYIIKKGYNPEPILKYYVDIIRHLLVHHFEFDYKLYRESFGTIEKYEDIPCQNDDFHIEKKRKFDEYVRSRIAHIRFFRTK